MTAPAAAHRPEVRSWQRDSHQPHQRCWAASCDVGSVIIQITPGKYDLFYKVGHNRNTKLPNSTIPVRPITVDPPLMLTVTAYSSTFKSTPPARRTLLCRSALRRAPSHLLVCHYLEVPCVQPACSSPPHNTHQFHSFPAALVHRARPDRTNLGFPI